MVICSPNGMTNSVALVGSSARIDTKSIKVPFAVIVVVYEFSSSTEGWVSPTEYRS